MGKFVAEQQTMTEAEAAIRYLTKRLRKVCRVVRIELEDNEFFILIRLLGSRRQRRLVTCEEIMKSSKPVIGERNWVIEQAEPIVQHRHHTKGKVLVAVG
jgi:hypothetical protein